MLATLAWALVDRPGPTAPTRHTTLASPGVPPSPPSDRRPGDTQRAARRFILAFLSDEVGVAESSSARAIRAGAIPSFAREILGRPPPLSTEESDKAPLRSLHVRRLPGRPDLALVSGSARRPSGPEQFAFLFARREGRWFALAPGE
jgi:hypothetical protein